MSDITTDAVTQLPGEDATVALAEETVVQTSTRQPGDAVVTQADAAALAAVAAEPVVELAIYEAPLTVPTATVAENVAARPNIVPDGPGTCAEAL